MISFGPIESKSNGYFIRCYHIAKSLTELNHEVLVFEFTDEKSPNLIKPEEGIFFVHIRRNDGSRNRVSRMLRNVLTFTPFHSIKFQLYSLVDLIRFRDHLKDCDFVFVEGALIPFGIILPKIFKKKVILDTHCVNKLLALCFKDRNFLVYFVRKVLWDLLERFAAKLSHIIIVVSERERAFVQTEYEIHESKIFVVPNVIEVQTSHSREKLINLRKKWILQNKLVITFVGNLESVQNRDAAEYVVNDLAPYFREKRKDVVFLIVGDGKENFKCNLSNVLFTGFVEDLAPLLEISDICIAPLRVGSGVKTKVLEYMAHGKPIISTTIGVDGIEPSVAQSSIVVAEIGTFAEKLLDAIEHLDCLQKPKQQKLIKKLYSVNSMQQHINEVLQAVKR